ncbi:MAG TPA: methyltransferase domain-containing protein [Bryobacteraceae bacterium]|jgi:hypothetical protein|nr:methyltransferase domain-containing protein [Bryobacteraceae bacterium]
MTAHSIMSMSMPDRNGMNPQWKDWSRRFIESEILEHASPERMRRNLREIALVNRLFGGHTVVRGLFAGLVRPPAAFTVLDVGAASGDMGAAIRRAFPAATVFSLDLQARHLDPGTGPCLAADAFHLPIRDGSVDFVFCSLFLHHFEDEAVVSLLAQFARAARRAVVAIDLERRRMAYHFLPATRWLFRWDAIMLNDGPISVRASFRKGELLDLARRAGLVQARVRRHDPWFRLSLSAPVERAPTDR